MSTTAKDHRVLAVEGGKLLETELAARRFEHAQYALQYFQMHAERYFEVHAGRRIRLELTP